MISINRAEHIIKNRSCSECNSSNSDWDCSECDEALVLAMKGLELLKEHEAKSVIVGRFHECPNCDHDLDRMHDRNFCGFCGQAVKWE